MVNFKEKYHFQGSGGSPNFSRGGGGVKLFPEGGGRSNRLFPIETHITCGFPGGFRPPVPPSGSALGCDLFSFPVPKMMRSPLAPVLVFLQLRFMFSVKPRNKIVSELTAWLLPGLWYPTSFAIRLCFLQSLNKDSSISFCWGSFLFLPKPFWQMMLFVNNVNGWRHIRWRNYRTHSNEHPC